MSAHVDKCKKTLILDLKEPIPAVQEAIEELRNWDKKQEKKRKLGCTIALVSLGVGVLLIILSQMASSEAVIVIGLVGGALAGGCMLVAFIIRVIAGRLNLEDRRYELASQVLSLLRADTNPGVPVNLQIDFRPHDHKSKFVRDGRVGAWKVNYYSDPWLSINGQLADGNRYAITMIEKLQNRSKTKRSASGKTKYKSKKKRSTEAMVSLKYKPSRYGKIEDFCDEMPGAVQLPPWVQPKGFSKKDNTFSLRAVTPQTWTALPRDKPPAGNEGVNLIAMMMLSLYQAMNLARDIQKTEDKQASS